MQVLVYGSLTDAKTGTQTGRLQRDGWVVRTAEPNAGWISKAFRFQGTDPTEFLQTTTSDVGKLVNRGLGQYTIKDAFLYTAPPVPGKYKLLIELEGKRAETTVEVSAEAPAARTAEKQTFSDEPPSTDPYRKLAEHYAPFIAQETWFEPKADFLARFDYDGDWRGDNNWENLSQGSSQAYVHYAAIETATHLFLHYSFFHPRDYSDNCVIGTCHENDNEGIILVVQKDGSEFGRLRVMQTLAHNNVYSYSNDPGIRPGVHQIEGSLRLWKESHPMVFLEGGGHGAYAANSSHSLYAVDRGEFQNTGVTYVFKGKAERPRSASDREVGYELLPIYEQWWTKSSTADWKEPTFDDYYEYAPFGGRPRMKNFRISGSFLGRRQAENKARPFWGWFDTRSRKNGVVNTGQWALDPAYSVAKYLMFPADEKFSLDYTHNPYLDISTEVARALMDAPAGFVAAADVVAQSNGAAPGASANPAASPTASLRGLAGQALGQVLAGGESGALGSAMQRLGVGSGGTDALRQLAQSLGGGRPGGTAAGECSVTVSATKPAEIVIRGGEAQPAAAAVAKTACIAPIPQSQVTVRVETRSGPVQPIILEQPGPDNSFSVKLRVNQPGNYDLVLRW